MNKQETNLILNEFAEKIEPVILELLLLNIEKKNHPLVKYQILTGGKRLRPALVLASCKLFKGNEKKALYPAASVEILHNYTLIIDDIIDNSSLRRGKPTVWEKYGGPMAECIGIAYVSSIFEKNTKEIDALLSATLKRIMAEGEILDILFEQSGREKDPYIIKNRYHKIKKTDVLKMMKEKTAVLFQTCCEIGGIIAQASKKQINYLKDYGLNLGLAFQVSDDILDIFGEEKKFGKKIGKDIEEAKGGNIVIYYALEELSRNQEKEFLNILKKKKKTKKDIQKAINLIKRTKAKEKALKYGENFVKKAKKNLNYLPKNKYNDFLLALADSLMKREK